MRYPKPLQKGGTIGFVAPSFGAAIEPYATGLTNAESTFNKLGFNTREYTCARMSSGIGISARPSMCGADFMNAYTDDLSDVLMSCGGGELMCETISHIDFDVIAHTSPKWFMGYSDNTNLVFTMPMLANTAAIYAPCAPSFGMEPWHESLHDAFDILQGIDPLTQTKSDTYTVSTYGLWELESLKDSEHPLVPYNTTEAVDIKAYDSNLNPTDSLNLEGRMLVGCLDCVTNLVGTRFDKVQEFSSSNDGILWCLEACEVDPIGIRRSLWQMAEAGWFEGARGFVFGRPYLYQSEAFGINQVDAVLTALDELEINVPVVLNADIGHLPPQMPLISGSWGNLSVNGAEVVVEMSLI